MFSSQVDNFLKSSRLTSPYLFTGYVPCLHLVQSLLLVDPLSFSLFSFRRSSLSLFSSSSSYLSFFSSLLWFLLFLFINLLFPFLLLLSWFSLFFLSSCLVVVLIVVVLSVPILVSCQYLVFVLSFHSSL